MGVAAKSRDHADDVVQTDALSERPLGRTLDHRAVGHRVGERNTQLDGVRPGSDQRVQYRHGDARRRIAGGDVRNQRRAPGESQFCEGRVDAVQLGFQRRRDGSHSGRQ